MGLQALIDTIVAANSATRPHPVFGLSCLHTFNCGDADGQHDGDLFHHAVFRGGACGPFLRGAGSLYRWIAIIAGFAGVIVMVRPGVQAFEPASLLALYSAFGYAIGQMMGRKLAQQVAPLVIANWQNAVYFIFAVVIGVIAQAAALPGKATRAWPFSRGPGSRPRCRIF